MSARRKNVENAGRAAAWIPADVRAAMFWGKTPTPDDICIFLNRLSSQCDNAKLNTRGMAVVELPPSWPKFLSAAIWRYLLGEVRTLDQAFLLARHGRPISRRSKQIAVAKDVLEFLDTPGSKVRSAKTAFYLDMRDKHKISVDKVRQYAREFKTEAENILRVERIFKTRWKSSGGR